MTRADLSEAIRRFETPFYIFDKDAAVQRVRMLKNTFGPRVKICYAMKANPFLVKVLEGTADCFEVCSPGELRICARAGLNMSGVVLSGVYKKPEDIYGTLETYRGENLFTAESPAQWALLAEAAGRLNTPVRILLRLTVGNQFGMDEADIRRIIAGRAQYPLVRIAGLQLFTATQRKNPQRMCRELQMLDQFLDELHAQYGYTAQILEYGPGLPVRYFDDEPDFEAETADALRRQLDALRYTGPVILELGRSIAAPCGDYVTKIVDIKTNCGTRYCLVDGGIHQLNYFGQMMAMKRPPVTHLGARGGKSEEWTVCGALCTINDVLLKSYPLSSPQTGEHLVFGRAGAYSMTECPALFLSRDLPQIILYSAADGFRCVRGPFRTDALNSADEPDSERKCGI